MYRIRVLIAAVMLMGAIPAAAQQNGFDIQAYRDYLQQNAQLSAGELLARTPAPLLHSSTAEAVHAPLFLDSVSIKFGLTADELHLLEQNSFVVTERPVHRTFQRTFAEIWENDLPVYISTDAILHALHLSYDEILKELEENRFYGTLEAALSQLRQYQAVLETSYGSVPELRQSLLDVDLYLSVATALLTQAESTKYPENEATLDAILQMVRAESPREIPLFSETPRAYDFSQLKVRGHYDKTPQLGRYFQAMMWMGRTEFYLTAPQSASAPPSPSDIQRQIIDAAMLLEALETSDAGTMLREMDALLSTLVGESDNVAPSHLRESMTEAGVVDAATFLDTARVSEFQRVLATKPYAGQRIHSQILMSDPMSPNQIKPPTAFLLMGQRFVIDSYVMANVVYDRIMSGGQKVRRMLPSSMDVLYALGNNAAAQLVEEDLKQYDYAPNLSALRYLIESHDDDFWNASLYNGWLNGIRALNIPDEVDELPAFMRTAAWWQQKMNTQLASWAQLRHDNLLYAKPSYSSGVLCAYPHAFVEPEPDFYRRLSTFAGRAREIFAAENMDRTTTFFEHFGAVMDTLEIIAEKQLAHSTLTEQERAFAKAVLVRRPNCGFATNGWYQKLIYAIWYPPRNEDPIEELDIVTADVHTAPTDEHGTPVGWVMHVGTGYLNLAVIVTRNEFGQQTAFVGPVLSYYEHVTENFQRLTDKDWKQKIESDPWPRPDWTNVYLADRDGKRRPPGQMLKTSTPPVLQPYLTCSVDVPTITTNYINLRYDPMPFPVTVTVSNDGSGLTDSLFATISFLPDLTLAGEDAPDGYTKVCEKAQLFPKQSTTVQWMLKHPLGTQEKRYTIRVVVKTANADSTVCETEVIIPAVESPILAPRDYCPNELVFVDSLDSYVPNPFTVRLTCINNGNGSADSVSGTLILPKDVVLDPPTQTLTQYFNPMSMGKWNIGDPVPEVTWTLRWTKRYRYDMQPEFTSKVTGVGPGGVRLDSTEVRCNVEIPGLLPVFTTRHEIPDSLGLRADGLDVEPNPFPVRFTVKNISHQVGSINRILLYFPTSDGLSLSPLSPNPTSFDPGLTLDKGEEKTFEWLIDVQNRITRRNVEIQMHAYDDEGNPLICSDRLPIANLRTALSDWLETSAKVLRCDTETGTYDPSTFVITSELSNDGGAELHEIEAEVTWLDVSGLDLIEYDPDFTDNTNPKTQGLLLPGEKGTYTWGFRVKNGNTSGISQYVTFNVDFGSRETPYITNGCETFVEIEPCNLTGIGEAPALAANCILYPNHPNPFGEWTTIRYALSQSVPVTLVVHDALGREVRRLHDGVFTPAGAHSARFDASGLPPGLYFYRLQAGGEVRVRRMVVR